MTGRAGRTTRWALAFLSVAAITTEGARPARPRAAGPAGDHRQDGAVERQASSFAGFFRWNPAASWYAFASASSSVSPQRADGVRIDPLVSVPTLKLLVCPSNQLSPEASSPVASFATSTAPASRSISTTLAS